MHRISISIPTLNEAKRLGQVLRQLSILAPPAWEILVVDRGSQETTIALARTTGARILLSDPGGRSRQMNLGAGGCGYCLATR